MTGLDTAEHHTAWPRGMARAALDLFYPRTCPGCDRVLRHIHQPQLCGPCFEGELFPLDPPFCSRCGERFHGAGLGEPVCAACRDREVTFDFARAGYHAHGLLRDLVHRLKYGRQIHLVPLLGHLLGRACQDPRVAGGDWVVVPVPLHPSRLRRRHFNQAAELARVLSETQGYPLIHALRRRRATNFQARLERRDRIRNLSGAFSLGRRPGLRQKVDGRDVLLVDDVFTTGSTVAECAKVLKREAGASKVAAITLARAGNPPLG